MKKQELFIGLIPFQTIYVLFLWIRKCCELCFFFAPKTVVAWSFCCWQISCLDKVFFVDHDYLILSYDRFTLYMIYYDHDDIIWVWPLCGCLVWWEHNYGELGEQVISYVRTNILDTTCNLLSTIILHLNEKLIHNRGTR